MRALIFAYEFPPVLAAQSLRWYYLANELALSGVEVDILTPSIRDVWGFAPVFADQVRIHRCFPGPFVGLSGWLAGHHFKGRVPAATYPLQAIHHLSKPRSLSVLEVIYHAIRHGLDQILIPDLRTEWLPFAWRMAKQLHAKHPYDLVISSHEPGVDLLLGLRAQREWGIPWIADLADPLVAPYRPRWRVRWDKALENRVCHYADAVIVTNKSIATLLADRHGVPRDRFTLIRQGFDHRWSSVQRLSPPPWSKDRLTILFTGTFYPGFRDPGPLLEAMSLVEGVCLVFMGDSGPFGAAMNQLGERVMNVGKLSHEVCLAWQRQADILLNLGNRQDDQVPGKVYEYLGAARPILHIAASPTDPVPELLKQLGRGCGVSADPDAIAAVIRKLHHFWIMGSLDKTYNLTLDAVQDYSWAAGAARLHALMERVSGARRQ